MARTTANGLTTDGQSIWAGLVFAATLLLSILYVIALARPPAVNSHGLPHPDFSSLLLGASGIERHGSMLWLGWALGCAQILLFTALLALGSRHGRSSDGNRPQDKAGLRGLGLPLLLGLAAYLASWTLLMVAYQRYLYDPDPQLILAMPEPTAVMLYLVWPVPLIFVLFYVFGFRRFVISRADEEEFNKLVARRQARLRGANGPQGREAGSTGASSTEGQNS